MAMDKEKLFSYFQSHYLSRQEVHSKLPLNISIDSFWQELLKRRKSRATILPLNNAAGMPYWYVLTDRMIAASERLCEEAMRQESDFDPYRAGMTSAMTEEMFFTSFVEGAQIPLQEAMDFLQRGTEPESIQEQMIWNNRRAWAEMTGTIYRPLDDSFVKTLAYMLTEEMEGCADGYRQTDQHVIAAMNSEPYDVPTAYSLPNRMYEYYAYLQRPDEHPLIKAAVAQAFLLVTRPFPEGNERLSRMMSSAVLMRCGYDFFRDISISSVIARESYRYYKCMREIIRAENGGDLTYFLQYYLELLVRALDMRNERIRKREEEALEREREMAKRPLKRTKSSTNTEAGEPPPESLLQSVGRKDLDSRVDSESLHEEKQKKTGQTLLLLEPMVFLESIEMLKYSQSPLIRGIPDKVRKLIEAGTIQFSTLEWAKIHEVSRKEADYECHYLFEKGWADRTKGDKSYIYTLKVIPSLCRANASETWEVAGEGISRSTEACSNEGPEIDASTAVTETGDSPPGNEYFENTLCQMETSNSENVRRIASIVRNMLSKGITRFTSNEWAETSGMNAEKCRDDCDLLLARKLVRNITPKSRAAVYAYRHISEMQEGPPKTSDRPSDGLIRQLQEIADAETCKGKRRFFSILLDLIDRGIYAFRSSDVARDYSLAESSCGKNIRNAAAQV